MMKILKTSFLLALFFLSSCTVSEENWHEAASKIKGQSVYITKDGVISARVDDRLSSNYGLNIFDTKSADIGYSAMKLVYKQHQSEYDNSNKITNVYILDLRSSYGSLEDYKKIISKEQIKRNTNINKNIN